MDLGTLHGGLLGRLLGPLVTAPRTVLVLLRLSPGVAGPAEHLDDGGVPGRGL
ncbi:MULTISPECIES: hypothetical protein [unclassified Streptomyces]|uniref:hypothetical protein n=1 Tax=unclassified Streptomyces TaxID=2593676 RepID=UPI002948C00F|nr:MULTISPECIES: hypothetical protein [unclassified Streptomyces]